MFAAVVLAAQRICDRVFQVNSNRNWKCTSAVRYRGSLITTGSIKNYTKSGWGSKLSRVLFQNGTENATMKFSASSWFLRATGGFRRLLLREMLSAQKAGQALRETQLKRLQESVRAAVLCIHLSMVHLTWLWVSSHEIAPTTEINSHEISSHEINFPQDHLNVIIYEDIIDSDPVAFH